MNPLNHSEDEDDEEVVVRRSPFAERARAVAARVRLQEQEEKEKQRVRREYAALILQLLILATLIFLALEVRWLLRKRVGTLSPSNRYTITAPTAAESC